MLRLTISPVIDSFLNRLETQPDRFRQVIFVSPYLEFPPGRCQDRWCRILSGLRAAAVDVALVTRIRGTATHGQNILLYDQHVPNRPAMYLPELHAKLYVAIGKDRRSSLCLLGSANLSEAAIKQ